MQKTHPPEHYFQRWLARRYGGFEHRQSWPGGRWPWRNLDLWIETVYGHGQGRRKPRWLARLHRLVKRLRGGTAGGGYWYGGPLHTRLYWALTWRPNQVPPRPVRSPIQSQS